MPSPSSYMALPLQTACHAVNGAADAGEARPVMAASIQRIGAQIAASKRFIGPDLRLVVLPEYVLTGFPMGEPTAVWSAKAALVIDGPEYQALSAVAKSADIFLAGNAYEQDPHFPGLYFQTSFVIAPDATVVLRYRRLISMFSPSPYDVYDAYVAAYGVEALFPVADTEIGRLAAIASEEILYPEIARAHALRGAEVFVHSSSESGASIPTPKGIAKPARAIENLAWVISANTAGIEGIAIPLASTDGGSTIIDHRGVVLSQAGFGESMSAYAEIDLAASRRYRRRPGMANLLARQPVGLWADAYAAGPEVQPRNSLIDEGGAVTQPGAPWYAARQRRVIEGLADKGII